MRDAYCVREFVDSLIRKNVIIQVIRKPEILEQCVVVKNLR